MTQHDSRGLKLFLCEKPSQARDIARELGGARDKKTHIECQGGITVTFAFGHLLEQVEPEGYDPTLEKWSLTPLPVVPEKWMVEVKKSAAAQMKVIKGLLSQADEVVIATDADREGEMIAREILEFARYRGGIRRLWLSALDPESIRKALSKLKPGAETARLYDAALARSRADWLVGMNMSRAATLLSQSGGTRGVVSIGRVQTPTLALVVRRDLEIEKFIPKDYFEIVAIARVPTGEFSMRHAPSDEHRILSKGDADRIAAAAVGAEGPVRVSDENKRESPPKLFSLSSLQAAASAKWGWSADHTLEVAQALYETYKLTTYPRTDCQFLPEEQAADAKVIYDNLRSTVLSHLPAADPIIRKSVFDNRKITAHHAIIPTKQRAGSGLNADAAKLYGLVAASYAAALMPDYEFRSVKVEMDAAGVPFLARGHTPIKPGWKVAFRGSDAEEPGENKLPELADGVVARIEKADVEAKRTKPPSRFTEGTLIEAMKAVARYVDDPAKKARLKESSGIGTEATRAGIIKTLRLRGFLEAQGKFVISTGKGRDLIVWLDKSIPSLADPGETAVWEDGLEEVEKGSSSVDAFTSAVANRLGDFISLIRNNSRTQPMLNSSLKPTSTKCPKSGEPVMEGDTIYTFPGLPGVTFGKEFFSRPMSADDWAAVVEGKSPKFDGFVSRRNGKKFAAMLRWNEATGRTEFEFGASDEGQSGGEALSTSCPKTGKPVVDRGKFFEFPGFPGLRAWKEICARTMTAEEYAGILAGCEEQFDGFRAKSGKPFSARLVYDQKQKKVSFQFDNTSKAA